VKLKDGTTAPKVDWTVPKTRASDRLARGVFHDNGYVGGRRHHHRTANGGHRVVQLTVDVEITDPGSLLRDQPALVAGGEPILISSGSIRTTKPSFRAASGARAQSAGRPPTPCTSKSRNHTSATSSSPPAAAPGKRFRAGVEGVTSRRRDGHDLRRGDEAIRSNGRRRHQGIGYIAQAP